VNIFNRTSYLFKEQRKVIFLLILYRVYDIKIIQLEQTLRSLKYPVKKEVVYFYDRGETIATFYTGQNDEIEKFEKENRKAVKQSLIENPEEYNNRVQFYLCEEQKILKDFKNYLFEFYDVQDNPKRDALWDKAWDKGNANGLREVAVVFDDLVDLIQ
jgi:hypothetical protein